MITSFGWTWEYIDNRMTLPRLYDLCGYWKENPPLHISVAAFLGVKTESKKGNDLNEIMAELGMSGEKINGRQ